MITSFMPICARCGGQPDDFRTTKKHELVSTMAMRAGWKLTTLGRWRCPQCNDSLRDNPIGAPEPKLEHKKFKRTKTFGFKRTK